MSTPQGNHVKREDVVISGISGAFPQSDNVEEFYENLLAGKDLMEENHRWGADVKGIPKKVGLLRNIDRFDHSFFGVSRKQVEEMDSGARILMEKTFEAIIDAGYNPQQLKGTKTGIFYGSYESRLDTGTTSTGVNEYTAIGKSTALMANRISYWADMHGPSLAVDTACSASLSAFDCAYKFIQNGDCDAAIVCTANVGLTPFMSQAFLTFGILDPNGMNRPFDAQASGFARGEAVVVVFLQKLKDARRVYANVIYTQSNCDGFKEEGIAFPSKHSQVNLFQTFYQDCDLNPDSISYIETHGTGTKVGDVVEIAAIDEFFCTNRKQPLNIGSVKSNMGHGEGSSGLCSLIKLIMSFQRGIIPPTINLKTLNPKIEAFHNGHVQVVTKAIPCEGECFAVSCYGVGGANVHVVLSPHKKAKNTNSVVDLDLPYLVTISGRTEEAVNVILNHVKKNATDVEYIRLLHEIFSENIDGHLHRGYVISNKESEPKLHHTVFTEEKRPIWFTFSGMGSQWPMMGKSLMKIPLFAKSIRKCHQILQSKSVDLIRIITQDDPQVFKNILNSFVGIAAIQIALCDILKAIDIKPDGIIGHSVGELGCAYADGCFTLEQTILTAYYRGLVSLETVFVHGTMAAVGTSYDTMKDLIPPEIYIACHNGPTSCTISGPTDIVQDFIKELKQKKIFVREVNTSNIAYHSPYIASAAPTFISHLKKIIPQPKLRSDKWICTSAPEHEWSLKKTKYSSAEYHTNNFLNPVFFEEGVRRIPENAIIIEIAPHGLLQAILKRSFPTACNLTLTSRQCDDGTEFLLNALGRVYELGWTPKLSNLYPPVQFPVSRSTPTISPLIRWQHDEIWYVNQFAKKRNITGECDIEVDYQQEDYEYLRDHVIDGRNLYPALGYLGLIWETMAIMQETSYQQLSIVFENVRFHRATNIPEKGNTFFHISIQKATNQFEITENDAAVASGIVRLPEDIDKEKIHMEPFEKATPDSNMLPMSKKDFYKELRLRGYHCKGLFKNVLHCNTEGTYGKVLWCNNFVTFMDTMAQFGTLNIHLRELIVPTFIRKIVIDVEKHQQILKTLDQDKPEFSIHHYPYLSLMCGGGIQILDVKGTSIARKRDQADPVLEKYQFVPYISEEQIDEESAIRLCVQVMLENLPSPKIKTIELLDQPYNAELALMSTWIANTLSDLPLIQASVNVLTKSETEPSILETLPGINIINDQLPNDRSCSLIALSDIQTKAEILDGIFDALKDGGFIITKESIIENRKFDALGLSVCFSRRTDANKKILLLRKALQNDSAPNPVRIQNALYSWVTETQKIVSSIKTTDEKLVVYAEKEPLSGILGFYNCLRNEEYGEKMRCFFIMDDNAPPFSLQNSFYKKQYKRDLSHNVYKNGQWGSYRHLLIDPIEDVEVTHAFNLLQVRGDLSSQRWVEGFLNPDTHLSEDILIHVYYSALNFRDVMITSGKISVLDTSFFNPFLESCHGIEYCGKDNNGVRYMGTTCGNGITTLAVSKPYLKWRVPDHFTMEEASTLPVAYATVIYGFIFKMNLKKGSSVLIHAACGAVGQAAINICLYYKCNIFVTVGTPEKVEFIKKTYPQIPESNIGNSRDTSFEKMIIMQTNGKGVDVVLNSLAEEKLRASLRCVAKNGHFVEIGKYDISRNNLLEMGSFSKSISFLSVQLDDMDSCPSEVSENFCQTFQDMLNKGIIKPICRTIFGVNEVESAIRYMAAGKHIGKVVIKIRDEEKDIHAKPVLFRLKAQPRVVCQQNGCYVIIGGLGGFGLELAEWLMIRGAQNIILSSRTGIKNGYQSYKIKLWKSYGINIIICTDDVTTEKGVQNLLQTATNLGPVIGIFNVAVILKDGPFDTQIEENFAISAGPKAIATTHLDKQSRLLCPRLEYFVVFSSISCGRGNRDQTNYGMSNSIMERICEARKADNLPALAVQWGAIGEVGVVADFAEDNRSIVIGGTLQQKVSSCLQALDVFMKQTNPIAASMVVAEKRHADSDIINVVANILGIKNLKTISLTWTLPELGMDSIMAVELKQVIEAEFDIFLSPQDLKSMTFARLYKLKEENKASKSGENIKTQYQSILQDRFINVPLVRIPFSNEGLMQEVSIQDTPTAFMFPGLEGVAEKMVPLAKNLNIQSLCFQYFIDMAKNEFEAYAEYFLQHITQRLGPNQEFHIIAHSLGTIFALEVAKVLEKQGRNGYLWFIDGSPTYFKSARLQVFERCNMTDEETIQCFVCINVVKQLAPNRLYDKFANHLSEANSWESKKKLCIALFPEKVWNKSVIYKSLDKLYSLTTQSRTYAFHGEPMETVRCTLIRTVDNIYNLDEFYDLSKYFKHPVQVHQVEADHASILGNRQTADIIMDNQVWKKE